MPARRNRQLHHRPELGTAGNLAIGAPVGGTKYLLSSPRPWCWSACVDLNHGPPGSEPGTLIKLSYTPEILAARHESRAAIHITDPRRNNAGASVSMGYDFPSRPRWRERERSPFPPTVPALRTLSGSRIPVSAWLPFGNTSPSRPVQPQVELAAIKNPTGLSPWREGPVGF